MDLRIWMKLGICGFFLLFYATQLRTCGIDRYESNFFDFIFKANKKILLLEKRLETTQAETKGGNPPTTTPPGALQPIPSFRVHIYLSFVINVLKV